MSVECVSQTWKTQTRRIHTHFTHHHELQQHLRRVSSLATLTPHPTQPLHHLRRHHYHHHYLAVIAACISISITSSPDDSYHDFTTRTTKPLSPCDFLDFKQEERAKKGDSLASSCPATWRVRPVVCNCRSN